MFTNDGRNVEETKQEIRREILTMALVSPSAAKQIVAKKGVRIGKDGLDAACTTIERLLEQAAEKAKADKRETIKARDFI